jgi:hypothetical protein
MKKLLLGLLTFGCFSTYSGVMHVDDLDRFVNVGKIAKIKLVKTLNIKPNTTYTRVGRTRCYLKHDSRNFDRSLTAPKEFTFTKVFKQEDRDFAWSSDDVGFYFSGLKSANLIYCSNEKYWQDVTIGDMKSYLSGVIELTLADPVEME